MQMRVGNKIEVGWKYVGQLYQKLHELVGNLYIGFARFVEGIVNALKGCSEVHYSLLYSD